jgi:hypothetical protein
MMVGMNVTLASSIRGRQEHIEPHVATEQAQAREPEATGDVFTTFDASQRFRPPHALENVRRHAIGLVRRQVPPTIRDLLPLTSTSPIS